MFIPPNETDFLETTKKSFFKESLKKYQFPFFLCNIFQTISKKLLKLIC